MKHAHIAAAAISDLARLALREIGFSEDSLREYRNCVPPHWHATWRDMGSFDIAFYKARQILCADKVFIGTLEGEDFDDRVRRVNYVESGGRPVCLPSFRMRGCSVGEYKWGDLHVRIDPACITDEVLNSLLALGMISFIKTVNGENWLVLTLTFDEEHYARRVFTRFADALQTSGIPFTAKLERAILHYHSSPDVAQLPMLEGDAAREWLVQVGT